ncbi:XVIPCD domain-containing protein [Stenotrophomonas sp. PS02289]|uniref:XVIPCD domain-containing protein n=1 Tax=Stenotrophomonas sp. PS02289 TaxID=2991422 RepID=UPI00249C0599|nr:XVIPCD domain-containing protein [Stenotrophomonas sp. PS02289]
MRQFPPDLPSGLEYVGFSGTDSHGAYNYDNAAAYVSDTNGRAGIIGNTPWGEYVDDVTKNPSQHPDFSRVMDKFKSHMAAEGLVPMGGPGGALSDMMWNAGSPRYFENAIATGKPLVAFVENAKANRGFSNFELTTALEHPNTRINGYPVSAFGPDPLTFVSRSAAEYQALERTLAQHATANGPEAVTVTKLRADLMPIEGYDALGKTLYARPLDDFKSLSLAEMTTTRVEWASARGIVLEEPRLQAEPPEPPHRTPSQPGAPRGPPSAATAAEVVAEATPHRVPGGVGPGMKVAGVAGLALMAHDFGTTGHKWVQLHAQGNEAAADSTAAHFVGRNVGGALGGFIAGAGVGLTTGSWTGPGAIITGIGGGAFGAYLGDNWAKQKDIDRVYTQEDSLGRTWQRDPADPEGRWYRGSHQQQVQSGDLGTGVEVRPVQDALGNDVTFRSRYVAVGTLERQLNHKAATASYELGLDHLPPARDPYRINASAETHPPRAPFETGRDYVRDARSGEWMLEIQQTVDGRVPTSHREAVNPERLPMLDEQSRTIIAQNAANSPASLAARYMVAHEQQRWDDFATREGSAIPSAIQNARDNPDTLKASNGQTYTRQADGQWLHDGVLFDSTANLNLRDELELTWKSQEAGVQGLSQMADQIWENRQLEPEGVRGQLEDLYAKHGIERTPEQLDATAAAVQQNLAQSGKPEYVTLELMADPRTHGPSADSAIAAFSDDGGNRMVLQSTTTMEDVARHQAQLAAAPAPAQSSDPAMLDAVTVTAPRVEHPTPAPAPALLPNHPDHPDHPAYEKIHTWVQGTGNWNEEQSHNVAASLYRKQAENPAFQRVDRVTGALGPNGEHNVVAVYAPHGDKPPFFNAVVDGREAMLQPAQQNLEQAEVTRQEQVRQQGREQEQQRQAPPPMSM